MGDIFAGKTVLVTGATGSFGNTIVPELLKHDVKKVIAYSRDEEKQWRMRRKIADPRLHFVIGDVRDADRIYDVAKVDYLYHAAALKFVPACEDAPVEAYKTNILGTLNVREACVRNGVKRAVFVSTDKAVKPVNAYGMSKAMGEKIWLQDQAQESTTVFGAVRYGNVLGSRGSIIPLFKELMSEGAVLPITDAEMSRFFLSLRQAIDLVMYAMENMEGGEIFIPNNPACLITDLAVAMAGPDYPLEFTGIRPGEKLVESLISEEETLRTEPRGERFVIHPIGRETVGIAAEFSSTSARQLSVEDLKVVLAEAGLL